MIRCLRKQLALILALLFLMVLSGGQLFAAETQGTGLYKGKPAKYVFLFIGDGMGFPQKMAAEMKSGKFNIMAMDKLPAQGVTTTSAANRFITGSAAAATAIGCGEKTNINWIGMLPDNTPIKSVAELAKEQGKKVGIISSVSIDHATPAAFYSHVPTRKMYYEIALQLANSDFEYFAGGGIKDPDGKKSKNPKGNVIDIAKKNGFTVVDNKADFEKLNKDSGKVLAWNKNLPDGKALPYVIDMTPEDIRLDEFLTKGIELLDNDKGFFIMLEGGKIDWACHANDAVTSIDNTLSFDKSIQVALDFAEKHPAETLIVVTGDHECGGLTMGFAGTKYKSFFNILDGQKISFQKFTDEVMADFKKTHGDKATFEDIKPVITEYFGLKFEGDPKADQSVLKPYQVAALKKGFEQSMQGDKVKSEDPMTSLLYGEYDPLTVEITHALNNNAGMAWTSYKHTGVPVGTSAMGVGQETFNGFYDNTDIAKKIMAVMGVEPKVYSFTLDKVASN